MTNVAGFISDISSLITSVLALYALLMMTPVDWVLVLSTIAAILALIATAITDYQNSPTRLASTILHFLAIALIVAAFYTIGVVQGSVSSLTHTSFQGLVIAAAVLNVAAYFITRTALKAKG